MQRLVVATRLAAGRRASGLEVDLPKVPIQFTDEEIEFYKGEESPRNQRIFRPLL